MCLLRNWHGQHRKSVTTCRLSVPRSVHVDIVTSSFADFALAYRAGQTDSISWRKSQELLSSAVTSSLLPAGTSLRISVCLFKRSLLLCDLALPLKRCELLVPSTHYG